jgi:hypothetical protein
MRGITFRLYGVEIGIVRPERGLTDVVSESVLRLMDDIVVAARKWLSSRSGGEPLGRGDGGAVTSS